MSQRSIEILVGRLITDEAFRDAFVMNRPAALQCFQDRGYDLTRIEVAAVLAVPVQWWREAATQIDVRLQKADLKRTEER